MHPEKMQLLLELRLRLEKCFGRTDVDSQPYDSPLSHVDLIFHFHKYFSSVAKKYLFEVKQILLTDLFVSHLAPFEFDMVTPLQRARRINYETGWKKGR